MPSFPALHIDPLAYPPPAHTAPTYLAPHVRAGVCNPSHMPSVLPPTTEPVGAGPQQPDVCAPPEPITAPNRPVSDIPDDVYGGMADTSIVAQSEPLNTHSVASHVTDAAHSIIPIIREPEQTQVELAATHDVDSSSSSALDAPPFGNTPIPVDPSVPSVPELSDKPKQDQSPSSFCFSSPAISENRDDQGYYGIWTLSLYLADVDRDQLAQLESPDPAQDSVHLECDKQGPARGSSGSMSTRSVLSDQFQYDVEPNGLLGDKVAKMQNVACSEAQSPACDITSADAVSFVERTNCASFDAIEAKTLPRLGDIPAGSEKPETGVEPIGIADLAARRALACTPSSDSDGELGHKSKLLTPPVTPGPRPILKKRAPAVAIANEERRLAGPTASSRLKVRPRVRPTFFVPRSDAPPVPRVPVLSVDGRPDGCTPPGSLTLEGTCFDSNSNSNSHSHSNFNSNKNPLASGSTTTKCADMEPTRGKRDAISTMGSNSNKTPRTAPISPSLWFAGAGVAPSLVPGLPADAFPSNVTPLASRSRRMGFIPGAPESQMCAQESTSTETSLTRALSRIPTNSHAPRDGDARATLDSKCALAPSANPIFSSKKRDRRRAMQPRNIAAFAAVSCPELGRPCTSSRSVLTPEERALVRQFPIPAGASVRPGYI